MHPTDAKVTLLDCGLGERTGWHAACAYRYLYRYLGRISGGYLMNLFAELLTLFINKRFQTASIVSPIPICVNEPLVPLCFVCVCVRAIMGSACYLAIYVLT